MMVVGRRKVGRGDVGRVINLLEEGRGRVVGGPGGAECCAARW